MKKYRVWHGEKHRSKMHEIVEARNGNEAKQKVKDMFPGHKISACWLIAEMLGQMLVEAVEEDEDE